MSTLWVWGVRSDVEGGQPQGVKHPHVAGAVLDRHGVVGGGLIQQGQRRMGLFRQLVVVIALGHDPLARLHPLAPDETGNGLGNVLKAGGVAQGDLEQGVG